MKKIALIGFGKFGKLLADLLAKHTNFEIFIIEKDQNKSPKKSKFKFVSMDKIGVFDVILPCVPISNFEELILEIKDKIKKDALFIDICSVKIFPTMVMQKHLPNTVSLLGTHPMWGPDSVKFNKGLKGLKVVLCPLRIQDSLLKKIIKEINRTGLDVIIKSPAEHDEDAANSQALAQFIGKTLELMPLKKIDFGTLAYDQLVNLLPFVENNTQQLFKDMQSFNPFATQVRKRFMEIAMHLSLDLSKDDKKMSVFK